MRNPLNHLLTKLDLHPVLVDVGASGTPPKIWRPIARQSVYVGFDPDQRDLRETVGGTFHRSIIVNTAITDHDSPNGVRFYFTKGPHCSSTLQPDSKSLSDFLFADLFAVEREGSVPAESLNFVLNRLGLPRIDWLKIDTQGTDLRIWRSVNEKARRSLLALDVEPGLINAYEEEDLFVDAHRELTRSGFWLSNLSVHGTVRMRLESLDNVASKYKSLTSEILQATAKKTPAWVEARYLRTFASLADVSASRQEFALLWVFAMLDEQEGFALDLAIEYEKLFGQDEIFNILKQESIAALHRRRWWALVPLMKSLMPASLKHRMRSFLRR